MNTINLYSQYKLLKHLDKLDDFKKGKIVYPIWVGFTLTNKCNNSCPRCTTQRKDSTTISFENAKDIIRQLEEGDVRAVTYGGGGEPTCYPNLEEIIRFTKERGMEVALCTNGYKLSEGVMNAVIDCCTWIRISLDADGPDIYKKTHGMPEITFNKVVENMSKLAEKKKKASSKVTIGVSYLLGPETISGIYNATKLCKEIGVDQIRFRPFFVWDNKRNIKLNGKEVFNELDKCKELDDNNFSVSYAEDRLESIVGERKRAYTKCLVYNFNTIITPDMKIYPCCMLENDAKYSLGNLKEKSFKEIWGSEERKNAYGKINLNDCPNPCMLDKHNELLEAIVRDIPHSNFL